MEHSNAKRIIRAQYTEQTIRVYQAYNDDIADTALANGRFVSPPFKRERMTWIKPSFLWTMYRSGWGAKDENQKRILAIDVQRDGFLWALEHSSLSANKYGLFDTDEAFKKNLIASPVRLQWDPERDIQLEPTAVRSLQIGLSKQAVERYVDEWIVNIDDITDECTRIKSLIDNNKLDEAQDSLPIEKHYPLPTSIERKIATTFAE